MQEIPEDIVERCRDGSTTAFAELVQQYERPLFAYLYRLNGTAPARHTEDLVQEIFLKVYQNIHNFKQVSGACFSSWLFAIARNHYIDMLRSDRTDSFSRDSEDEIMADLTDRKLANPLNAAADNEIAQRVGTAVTELPETFRTALILRYYEDMSYSRIAEIMNCNEGTAKSRVARAKQMLGKLFDSIRQVE